MLQHLFFSRMLLLKRASELSNVEVNHVLLLGDDPLSKPGMAKHFRHNSLFVGPGDRQSIAEGNSDYVPVHLSQIPALFRADIFLLMLPWFISPRRMLMDL